MRLPWFVVLVALASGLACSPVASGDDEAGVTTNHGSDEGTGSSGGTGTTGTSGGTGTTGTTGSTDDSNDTLKLDLPFMPDLMRVDECTTSWLTWDDVKAKFPECMIVPDSSGGCWTDPMLGCTPAGPSGCNCPDGDCIGTWSSCSGDISGWGETTPGEVCGPFVIDGQCCSIGEFTSGCAE